MACQRLGLVLDIDPSARKKSLATAGLTELIVDGMQASRHRQYQRQRQRQQQRASHGPYLATRERSNSAGLGLLAILCGVRVDNARPILSPKCVRCIV